MKKILSLLIVICMFSMTLCVFAEADASQLVGDWHLISVDGEQMSDTGMGFTLSADGNAVLSWSTLTIEAQWRVDEENVVFSDGESDILTCSILPDGTLMGETEGSTYIFAQTENTESYTQTEESTDVSAEDFIGNWKPVKIIYLGSEYAASDFEFDTQISISDGEATLIADGEEIVFDAVFSNGAMVIGDENESLECRLREDGTMVYELEEDGVTMDIINEPVA